MKRQSNYIVWCFMLVLSWLAGCSTANQPAQQLPKPTATSVPSQKASKVVNSIAVPQTKIISAIKKGFGSRIKVAVEHKPFYLLGDFDGDGYLDLAVVVHIRGKHESLARGVI